MPHHPHPLVTVPMAAVFESSSHVGAQRFEPDLRLSSTTVASIYIYIHIHTYRLSARRPQLSTFSFRSARNKVATHKPLAAYPYFTGLLAVLVSVLTRSS